MLGFYNYTVVLTYLGMLFGFTGLTCAAGGRLHTALLCLMAAGVCDMFDGKIASTMQRTLAERRFGIQIDSLSDLICFGVLPAGIVWSMAPERTVTFVVSGLYVLAALIRLAWFNVDEEERQSRCDGPREVYLGLPVTTSALLLPALLALLQLRGRPLAGAGTALLAGMGVAFLTPFRLKKPKLPGKLGMLLCGCGTLVLLLWGVEL